MTLVRIQNWPKKQHGVKYSLSEADRKKMASSVREGGFGIYRAFKWRRVKRRFQRD